MLFTCWAPSAKAPLASGNNNSKMRALAAKLIQQRKLSPANLLVLVISLAQNGQLEFAKRFSPINSRNKFLQIYGCRWPNHQRQPNNELCRQV